MCSALEKYAPEVFSQHYFRRVFQSACFDLKAVKQLNQSAVKIRAASRTAKSMDGLEVTFEKH